VHSAFATSPDGYGRKEIGFAFDCGCRLTGLEVGCGRCSTEIVGEGHERSAVQNAEPVIELLASDQFCRYAFGRYVGHLQAEEFGKGRLLVGRFIHL
jgi:hypothetical protein